MQSIDVSQDAKSIQNQLASFKAFNENAKATKDALASAGDSLQQANSDITAQLDKISEYQKRFQRNVPTSMDNLLNFLGMTESTGKTETYSYIRKKLIQTAVKIEPQIQEILARNTIKALGCSQEQTYVGISLDNLNLQGMRTRPITEGIFVPVESVDFFGALKKSPTTIFGKFYYEKLFPGLTYTPKNSDNAVTLSDSNFEPYGGRIPYSMNRQLYEIINSQATFSELNSSKYYQGKSLQPLFDIQYVNTNGIISGDFFRIFLIDRVNSNGVVDNSVGTFITDYYKTIKIIDPVVIATQLVNYLIGAANPSASIGPLENQKKFETIIQRILGLCFDSRQEIDVSGVSKIAELDGVDNSFFEFTEMDLRKIDNQISNIQLGVVEFVDCDNVKLPFNNQIIEDELVKFRDELSDNTDNENVDAIEKILDSVTQNPEWQNSINLGLDVKTSWAKDTIKKLPLAIASGILTPKVLLPIFTLLQVVQRDLTKSYNEAAEDLNPIIQSANTESNKAIDSGNRALNLVNSPLDFLKKFRKFNIEVISEINAIFLKELFELLKKDIIGLLTIIVKDITRKTSDKNKLMILRLLEIAEFAAQVIGQLVVTAEEARKCKSLLGNIIRLIKLLLTQNPFGVRIPKPLLALSELLPGYSSTRATINIFELMQSYGLDTGPLPDGSPNLVGLYTSAVVNGMDKEQAENGKITTFAVGAFGPVLVTGKSV